MAYGREQFATDVLSRLGINPNRRPARRGILGWAAAEGGHTNNDARWNFLNTTLNMPGSGDTGTQGNISVYKSPQQGVKATVKTLRNGNYDGIIQALRSGSPSDIARAIDASPWGTHGSLLYQTIRQAKPGQGRQPSRFRGNQGRQNSSLATPVSSVTYTPGSRGSLVDILSGLNQPTPFIGNKDSLLADVYEQNQASQQQTLGFLGTLLGGGESTGPTTTITPGQPVRNGGGPQSVGGPASSGSVAQARKRANIIDNLRLPYQWGGGHGKRIDDVRKAEPLDCSGAVSAVLGIDPRVSGDFGSWGKPGRSKNGKGINVYYNDEHVLMEIDGKFFGTSSSNPGGGAGWIDSSVINPNYLSRFKVRHV